MSGAPAERYLIRSMTFLLCALLLVGCQRGAPPARGEETGPADVPVPLMTNEVMLPTASGKRPLPDDRWIVPVSGGTLDIGVDTVGSGGAEEHTTEELRAMLEEPDDGFPDYTVSIMSHSSRPSRIRWQVAGEGPHPVDAHDMGTLTSVGPQINGHLPRGTVLVGSGAVQEISVWAVQDHRPEPCEGFRISLFDGATDAPLLDGHRRPVVAHSEVHEQFDPRDPERSQCH